MGDRLGTTGAVGFFCFLCGTILKEGLVNLRGGEGDNFDVESDEALIGKSKQRKDYKSGHIWHALRLRPFHDEHTRSRLITEVKHRRAGIVLGWGTAWELPVP